MPVSMASRLTETRLSSIAFFNCAGSSRRNTLSTCRASSCARPSLSDAAGISSISPPTRADSRKFTSAASRRDSRSSTYSVSATKRFIGNCTNFPSTSFTSFSVKSNFICSSRLKLGQPVFEGKIEIFQVHKLTGFANGVTQDEPALHDLQPPHANHQLQWFRFVDLRSRQNPVRRLRLGFVRRARNRSPCGLDLLKSLLIFQPCQCLRVARLGDRLVHAAVRRHGSSCRGASPPILIQNWINVNDYDSLMDTLGCPILACGRRKSTAWDRLCALLPKFPRRPRLALNGLAS